MKILLISPGTPDEIDNKVIRQIPYLYAKAFNAPHAIATVAALTPEEHEVVLHDEYMRGPSENFLQGKEFDIIGISVTSNQLQRSLAIASACRKYCPSALVVAGGIGVETLIYKNKDDIDVVVHGEAEETWPKFLEDFKKGKYLKVYKSLTKPDMTKTPPPRWDLLGEDIIHYNSVSVQTTRGCPFDCSFCDVIYTYGRKPRSKTVEQVLVEIRRLNELKVMMVFIADDNFAGDKKYVKELLRKMIVLNNSFKIPMGFFTQLDITVAEDDELLQLLADANFYNLMIGVESINADSLKDMNKKQNMGISAVDAIKKIQSYGMAVLVHMIIGADSDGPDVFKNTAQFVQDANIVFHICHPLAAPPGTKMWYDYKRSGRLITTEHDEAHDKMDILTNIIPKQMTRIELMEGLADYWDHVYTHDKFFERAIGFIKGIQYRPKVKDPGLAGAWALRKLIGGVFKYYLFKAEKKDRQTFFKILRSVKKDLGYLMPKIIYMYTFFLIDCKRSKYDADVAREMALWERENPHKIKVDSCEIPVSQKIREHASLLVKDAFAHVRGKIAAKEIVYKSVVRALLDFSDRFGDTFDVYDEFQKEHLKNACERAIGQDTLEEPCNSATLAETPPPGFTREIMDALDNAVRYRNMYT
jgi:radical SAM superfamily enzyme YgiQ (UPF0313 family)